MNVECNLLIGPGILYLKLCYYNYTFPLKTKPMRTTTPFFTLLLICMLGFYLISMAQDRIKGNGNITEKTFTVQSFDEIKIDGVFTIHLTQGNTESVKVSIDDNLLQYIVVENDGNRLVVKWNKHKNQSINNVKSNLYITFKNIHELDLNHVGKLLTTNTLKLKELKLNINSVGETNLALNTETLNIRHDGVGSLNLNGTVQQANIRCSGVGSLKAFDLIADKLTLDCSGVGSAEVTAEKEISINASGVGGVRYQGNAKTLQLNASGIGRVKKV